MAKLFVLGSSGAGKTPIAKMIADRLGVPHIGASAWVRRNFPVLPADADEAARTAQIAAMTAFSTAALRENPNACLDVLWGENSKSAPCVVEGMRNPFDLIRSFDSRTDFLLLLKRADNSLQPNQFETGIDVISAAIDWLITNGISRPDQLMTVVLPDTSAIEPTVEQVIAHLNGRVSPDPHPKPSKIHAPVGPIELLIQHEYLHKGDPAFAGQTLACRAFAVSSYPGSPPTFSVMLDDGAMFAYVPAHVLRWRPQTSEPALQPEDLFYHCCPSGDIAVSAMTALQGQVQCYFKRPSVWVNGEYKFTIDWYEGNDMLHFVLLENGQVAFVPQHKMKFGGGAERRLPPYKKLPELHDLALTKGIT